jgi:hypothetical protein
MFDLMFTRQRLTREKNPSNDKDFIYSQPADKLITFKKRMLSVAGPGFFPNGLARAAIFCEINRTLWRDGRVAEGGGLLNRYTVKSRIGGSNPPLSAILYLCGFPEFRSAKLCANYEQAHFASIPTQPRFKDNAKAL